MLDVVLYLGDWVFHHIAMCRVDKGGGKGENPVQAEGGWRMEIVMEWAVVKAVTTWPCSGAGTQTLQSLHPEYSPHSELHSPPLREFTLHYTVH